MGLEVKMKKVLYEEGTRLTHQDYSCGERDYDVLRTRINSRDPLAH